MGRPAGLIVFLLFGVVMSLESGKTCAISGRVIDDRGNAVPAAAVTAAPVQAKAGHSVGGTATDREGEYCIANLAAGDYMVRAFARTEPPSASPACTECCRSSSEFVPSFHPRAVAAGPVSGASGIDIVMRRSPAFCVRGEVRDRGGKPLSRVGIRLEADLWSATVFSEGGRFLLTNLTSGTYTLVITRPNEPRQVVLKHTLRIEARSIGDLVITAE